MRRQRKNFFQKYFHAIAYSLLILTLVIEGYAINKLLDFSTDQLMFDQYILNTLHPQIHRPQSE